LAAAAVVFTVASASAGVTMYTSRAAFNAQGVIVENYGFEDFSWCFNTPPDPWLTHGVLYNSRDNLIVGNGCYGTPSQMIAYNFWTPMTGLLDQVAHYGMFGFDFGLSGGGDVNMTVSTNAGSYSFFDVFYQITPTTSFFGWVADPGEYFTSFNVTAVNGSGNLVLMDNVTLGNPGAIPAPAAAALIGLGLFGFGLLRRRAD
jgi:hypothetical protein